MTFCASMPRISIGRRGQKRKRSWQVWQTKANCLASQMMSRARYPGSGRTFWTCRAIARLLPRPEYSFVQGTVTLIHTTTLWFNRRRTARGNCSERGVLLRTDELWRSIPCNERKLAQTNARKCHGTFLAGHVLRDQACSTGMNSSHSWDGKIPRASIGASRLAVAWATEAFHSLSVANCMPSLSVWHT